MSTPPLRLSSTLLLALLVSATTTTTVAAQTGAAGAPSAGAAPLPPPPPPPPGPGPAYAPPPAYSPPPPGSDPPVTPIEATEPPKHLGVFLDPLNLVLGTFGAELSVSPAVPVAINVGFQYRKDDVSNDPLSGAQIDLTQYGFRGGVQIFPTTERSMRGFYLYPRGTYVKGSTNETATYKKGETSGLELAGMAGYQWRWNNGFAIRLGGGVAYRKIEVELSTKLPSLSGSSSKVGVEGATLAAEFALGWCF